MKLKILVLMLILFVFPVQAEDIQGQTNTVVLGDYMTNVYYQVAGFVSITSAHRFVDSTMLINRINSARENCANKFPAIQRDTIIVIVAGTQSYSLPSDFKRIEYASAIFSGTGLEVDMKPSKKDGFGANEDATGAPTYYRVFKREIQISPVNNSGDSVIVHYIANSNVLSANTDTCNVDKEYREYIVLKASESILQGKMPTMGEFGKMRLEDVITKLKIEEDRLVRAGKSIFETVTQ